jgi:hypothetical protein
MIGPNPNLTQPCEVISPALAILRRAMGVCQLSENVFKVGPKALPGKPSYVLEHNGLRTEIAKGSEYFREHIPPILVTPMFAAE